MSKILSYTEYKREQALFLQRQYYSRNNRNSDEEFFLTFYVNYLLICSANIEIISKIKFYFKLIEEDAEFNEQIYNEIDALID